MQPHRRQMRPVEQRAHIVIGLGVAREGDDRKPCHLLGRDEALAEAQGRAGQEADRVIAQHPAADARLRGRPQCEGELDLLRQQARVQIGRDVDLDLQREIGIALVDALDQPRQPVMHDGLGHAESENAAHRRAVADFGQHLRTQADQLLGIDQHLPSARGGRGHAVIAVEQLDAELALELGDALGDRGLGGIEALRRAAEAAQLHHPEKCLDGTEIQHRPRLGSICFIDPD